MVTLMDGIVVLIGSVRFKESFEREAARLTKERYVVLMPQTWEHVGDTDDMEDYFSKEFRYANTLEQVHIRKIDLAHEVRVINCGGYIGKATAREIEYASRQGKTVTFMEIGSNK